MINWNQTSLKNKLKIPPFLTKWGFCYKKGMSDFGKVSNI